MLKPIAAALLVASLSGVVRAADAPPAGAAPPGPASPSTDTPVINPAGPTGGGPVTATPTAAPAAPTPPPPPAAPAVAPLQTDVLPSAGYVPGYRTFPSFTMAPNVPRVSAAPGNVTPGFGAPIFSLPWTFKWSGFLNNSFQPSIGHRMVTGPDQTGIVLHVPPQTVDEYASFLGTNTMPGNWVQLNMAYGNPVITANLTLSTWNPTDPTSYYQLGSQNFIQNAYLAYQVPPIGDWTFRVLGGYFYTNYGGLGQYGLGMYTNAITALVRGVGEDVASEYKLSPKYSLLLEEGFMGNRNGQAPDGSIPNGANGMVTGNAMYPSAWVAHVHAGLAINGPRTIRINTHFLVNWSQDDRTQCQSASILIQNAPAGTECFDNPTYRQFNSAEMPNAYLYVAGADVTVNDPFYGYFAAGVSYTTGTNVSLLHGVATYGGEGPWLVDRWWGSGTSGSGSLYVAGVNWSGSLRHIISAPAPARQNAPDLILNAGAIVAYATLANNLAVSGAQTLDSTVARPEPIAFPSTADQYGNRLRYKLGVDGLYTAFSWVGFGMRVDRVVPTNKEDDQNFWVLAPRIVFHSSWAAREALTLLYARWLYGSNTHPDASSLVPPDGRLDDQLIALNVNVWW